MIPRALAAALLAALAAACGDDAPPPGPATGADLLADPALVVDRARPDHALPAELAALRDGSVHLRERPLPASAWVAVERLPPRWAAILEQYPERRAWRSREPVPVGHDGLPPRLYLDGERLLPINQLRFPVPDHVVWFEEDSGSLFSLSAEPPDGVVVRRAVPAATAFGPLQADLAAGRWELRRHTLGGVSRPALLLPPPGHVELDLGVLRAERLEFAVGLARQDLALVDGDVVHGPGARGDGVRLALELAVDGRAPERVWEARLAPPADASAWREQSVDLSAWRGQRARLRLLSEPEGEGAFDLALWSGLRLRGGDGPPPARPHVVLVVLDTLRADALGVYGREPSRTPRLDAWIRAHAVVVDDAVSTASWTLPATASLFTGLALHQHGVHRAVDSLPAQGPPTLADLLADAGYETRAVTAGGYLRPAFGLDRGFDRYEVLDMRSSAWGPTLDWLDARDSSAPVFLLVHSYWVHAPWPWDPRYVAPDYAGPVRGVDVDYPNVIEPYWNGELDLEAPDGAALRALYDALLTELDVHLAALLERVERSLGPEGLVLVITSDHGEAFLEHEVLGHGQALWQELLEVPLVIRRADARPGRLAEPASLVDVLPTLLHEVGLEPPPGLPGRALFAPSRGPVARVAQLDARRRALLFEGRKLLTDDGDAEPPRLYDLRADPAEAHDLAPERPDDVDRLAERLERFLEAHPVPVLTAEQAAGLDPDTLAELRALGYLGDDGR